LKFWLRRRRAHQHLFAQTDWRLGLFRRRFCLRKLSRRRRGFRTRAASTTASTATTAPPRPASRGSRTTGFWLCFPWHFGRRMARARAQKQPQSAITSSQTMRATQ
jgi:hypothetical protein